jgi:MtrB/PioB family decaheme-associated outer membrane protein
MQLIARFSGYRLPALVIAVAAVLSVSPARSQTEPQVDRQAPPADATAAQEPPKADKPATAPAATAMPLWDRAGVVVEPGVSTYSLRGALPGKFQEHRYVPRGFSLRRLEYSLVSPDSPYWGSLKGTELPERDQTLKLDAGRVGIWRTRFLADEVPHFYANSRTLFTNTSPYLQVSPGIRGLFQSIVDGQTPPNIPASFYDAVRRELAIAPIVTVATHRDTTVLKQSFRPTEVLELHVQGRATRLKGVQPLSMGTFARQNNIPTSTSSVPCAARPANDPCDGQWESLGVELPAPVNAKILALNAGALFTGSRWSVGADYDWSQYRSPFGAITYENPFRISDASGNPPGSAVGRNRMVLQQHAVYPNNTDSRLTIRAFVDLPHDAQLNGLTSIGRMTQNQQFLPYTLNTALAVSRVGGSANLPSNFDPTNPAFLPQQSLNGRVNTLNDDYSLVSRPRKNLTFRVQYRDEDQDNKSDSIVFPGMTRFGESNWVTSNDYYGNQLRNFPTSFKRADYIADARWDVKSNLSVDLDYDRQTWHRTFRDVPRTAEDSVRARVDFRPASAVTVKAQFLYGDRKPNLYKTIPFTFNAATNTWELTRNPDNGPNYNFEPGIPLEAPNLRRYDETDRKRKEAIGSVDFRLTERTTFSLSSRIHRDDYTPGAYGLNSEHTSNFSGDFTATPTEQSFLYASYSWDRRNERMRGLGHLIDLAVPGVTGCCANYPIANTWVRNSRGTLNTLTTGANYATAGDKTIFDASYVLSLAKEKIHSFNPFAILANSPRTAAAYNYPDTSTKLHEVILSVTRTVSRSLRMGVQYRFESYHVDDFYLNDLSTYPQGSIIRGGFPSNLPRQIFLNARYGNYRAHEAFVFLNYHSQPEQK